MHFPILFFYLVCHSFVLIAYTAHFFENYYYYPVNIFLHFLLNLFHSLSLTDSLSLLSSLSRFLSGWLSVLLHHSFSLFYCPSLSSSLSLHLCCSLSIFLFFYSFSFYFYFFILLRVVTQESNRLEVAPRPPIALTNAVSWRSEGTYLSRLIYHWKTHQILTNLYAKSIRTYLIKTKELICYNSIKTMDLNDFSLLHILNSTLAELIRERKQNVIPRFGLKSYRIFYILSYPILSYQILSPSNSLSLILSL